MADGRAHDFAVRADAGSVPTGLAPFDRRVIAVGGVVFAVLMALSPRYGFQRDELYFLDAARHLQASYVDQPVLAPLLARVSLDLFGVSLPGLRVWPALAAWATVVVGGLTARELGGGRRPQLLAAVAVATMPVLWAADHVANTTPYAVLALAALALVVVRIGRTGDPRWWPVAGLALGLGVADNHQPGFFAVALVVGALFGGGRRLVLNRWFAAGAAIAVAFVVPDIWWQSQHEWATIAMTRQLNRENGGLLNIPVWAIGQLLLVCLALVWVWPVGLRLLWRSERPLWRALVWAYGLLFVLYALTTGSKIYYLAGAYVYLLAAGAVAVDGWLYARRLRIGAVAVATALLTVVLALGLLPILPLPRAGSGRTIDSTLAETVGWPELVDTVRDVWNALPPGQRAQAVIFTENYSEAGAINELGRGTGLPTAVSGHNSVWWWGPGDPDATTVVAVASGSSGPGYAGYLGGFFTTVREAATISNPYGVRNIEAGGHVYVCTGPRLPWSRLWPRLRHYD
ncbi:glycosyltransferase family 39 protein [Sphaerisporangium sp. NPDC005288]|uniref:ArnT family glycosyltransferase n=1 Tax=Sphaerisporangium sp. NPDC005288 TaxID=3155114 RepID=UPI0033B845F4